MEVVPIYYTEDPKPAIKEEDLGMNFSLFTGEGVSLNSGITEEEKKEKKKKKTKVVDSVIDVNNDSTRELNDLESNRPYAEKYVETNNILKGAIIQLDIGIKDMQNDVEQIRNSRTLKGKYQYLSLIQGAMGNYIGNKIAAAREINNTITKCNELELRRAKELKALDTNKDDDALITDAYRAFVNTPVGSMGYAPLGPSSTDMTIRSNRLMSSDLGVDTGYQNYINNMTPQQHMMALESNPDIEEVVVFNQATGEKYFEVINVRTNEVIPNVDKRDKMFIEDLTIDKKNGIARNINLGETYRLVIIGESPTINEY